MSLLLLKQNIFLLSLPQMLFCILCQARHALKSLTIKGPVPVQTIVVRDNGVYLLKTPGWVSRNTQFKLIVSNSATHPIHFLKTFFVHVWASLQTI